MSSPWGLGENKRGSEILLRCRGFPQSGGRRSRLEADESALAGGISCAESRLRNALVPPDEPGQTAARSPPRRVPTHPSGAPSPFSPLARRTYPAASRSAVSGSVTSLVAPWRRSAGTSRGTLHQLPEARVLPQRIERRIDPEPPRREIVRRPQQRLEPVHRLVVLAGEDVDPGDLVLQVRTGVAVAGQLAAAPGRARLPGSPPPSGPCRPARDRGG